MDTLLYILRFLLIFLMMVFIIKIVMIIANYIGEQIVKFLQDMLYKIRRSAEKR